MSSLGDQLWQAYTGGRPQPVGGWRELIAELRGMYGSERRASEATGISRRQWYRWKAGTANPKPATIERLIVAVRTGRLAADRPTDTTVKVEIDDVRKDRRDGEIRTLRASQLNLRPGTMAKVDEAYVLTGNADLMAAAFLAGVRNGFYRAALSAAAGSETAQAADEPDEGQDPDDEVRDALDLLYEDYDGPDDGDLRGEEHEFPDPDSPVLFSVVGVS